MSATHSKPHRPNPYERLKDLPKLIPLWPSELADASLAGRRRLLGLLARSLRAERRRGLAGHWSYDLARHAALVAAYRAERCGIPGTWSRGLLRPASAITSQHRLLPTADARPDQA
jgi:uncharacterized protein YcaQ